MIVCQIIPHKEQRYETCGDWRSLIGWIDLCQFVLVNVSDTGNADSNELIGIHEIIELTLCEARGITSKQVDEWDLNHLDSEDPGSLEGCPYKKEHDFATRIEMLLAVELGIKWEDHEANIAKLFEDFDTEFR